jgi:hypothetical protein
MERSIPPRVRLQALANLALEEYATPIEKE